MRVPARILLGKLSFLSLLFILLPVANAQSIQPSQVVQQQSTSLSNFLTPNVDPNVPVDHHSYSQISLIDILSAFTCQLTGIDPTNPQQPCLGVNPMTGKIGLAPTSGQQTFGQAQTPQPQVGGALGAMTGFISTLYIPAVSTSQYTGYLASNFGIVHQAMAANLNPNSNCSTSPFGYGFCGLSPVFNLWTGVRDLSYAFLTILFVAIGIGVMLRFRVDPRTVMTLQNQIPRVIIAILLITFSYAIAGAMIDLMWTVTYAGISFISNASNSQVALNCPNPPTPLAQNAEQRLFQEPVSFVNTIFRADCKGFIDSGILNLAQHVSSAVGDLLHQIINDLLVTNNGCGFGWGWLNPAHDVGCIAQGALGVILSWVAEQLVKLIIIVTILIQLFRLWYELIKAYLIFIMFVIMGPIWIVLGLIPGRPMGFEKWLRIIFANLAVFPLVAFILVFARVIVDAVPHGASPQNIFIPPLVGNPSMSTFADLMGFGAIILAPSIPNLIKERLKAKSQSNLGPAIGAALSFGAGAAMAPGKALWERSNRIDPRTQQPVGMVARAKQNLLYHTPGLGKRAMANEAASRAFYRQEMSGLGDASLRDLRRGALGEMKGQKGIKNRVKKAFSGAMTESRKTIPAKPTEESEPKTGEEKEPGTGTPTTNS